MYFAFVKYLRRTGIHWSSALAIYRLPESLWLSYEGGLWCDMIWYDTIWYDIYLLTAIGLSPSGSSTVHIYTQTIHRTTQNKQYIEHNNYGIVQAVLRLG